MAVVFRGAGTAAAASGEADLSPGLPAGTASGDLLVAMFATVGGTAGTRAASGWALMPVDGSSANPTTDMVARWMYKIAGPSEAAPTFTGGTITETTDVRVFGWSGVDTADPFDVDGRTVVVNPGTSIDFPSLTSLTDGARGTILLASVRLPTAPSGWATDISAYATNVNTASFGLDKSPAGALDPGAIALSGTARRATGVYLFLKPSGGGGTPPPTAGARSFAVWVGG